MPSKGESAIRGAGLFLEGVGGADASLKHQLQKYPTKKWNTHKRKLCKKGRSGVLAAGKKSTADATGNGARENWRRSGSRALLGKGGKKWEENQRKNGGDRQSRCGGNPFGQERGLRGESS